MERISSQRQSPAVTAESLRQFKEEIAPIFGDRFVTLGHGTRIEVVGKIVSEGLEMKAPALQTTLIGLENTEQGVNKILNWEHNNARGIVVAMIPKELEAVSQQQLLEPVEGQDEQYGNHWKLPPRFIKGYIDVEARKFVPNPLFEENPRIQDRVQSERKPRFMEAGVGESTTPSPSSNNSPADIF